MAGKYLALLFGIVAAQFGCSDSGTTTADALAACAPLTAPARCVPHGLRAIELSGDWTLTGTRSDDHCLTQPETTQPVSYRVTLKVVGCTFQDTGQIDDTVAIYSQIGSSSDDVSICVDVTSALSYEEASSIRCIPTSAQRDNSTIVGTLVR
ncbi:MAG: hypothetical protein ABJE66_05250 [Deltaproteobacteria bacterium]